MEKTKSAFYDQKSLLREENKNFDKWMRKAKTLFFRRLNCLMDFWCNSEIGFTLFCNKRTIIERVNRGQGLTGDFINCKETNFIQIKSYYFKPNIFFAM